MRRCLPPMHEVSVVSVGRGVFKASRNTSTRAKSIPRRSQAPVRASLVKGTKAVLLNDLITPKRRGNLRGNGERVTRRSTSTNYSGIYTDDGYRRRDDATTPRGRGLHTLILREHKNIPEIRILYSDALASPTISQFPRRRKDVTYIFFARTYTQTQSNSHKSCIQ